MIVKYMRERGFQGKGQDPYLTIGKEYYVLDVSTYSPPHPTKISIECDDNEYGCFNLECFDIVDDRIPPDWSFNSYPIERYCLSPKEFLGDFWDLYNDGDTEAEMIYKDVIKKIRDFHKRR